MRFVIGLIISNPDWGENLVAGKKNFTSAAAKELDDSSEMALGMREARIAPRSSKLGVFLAFWLQPDVLKLERDYLPVRILREPARSGVGCYKVNHFSFKLKPRRAIQKRIDIHDISNWQSVA